MNYCCMGNIEKIISKHSLQILNDNKTWRMPDAQLQVLIIYAPTESFLCHRLCLLIFHILWILICLEKRLCSKNIERILATNSID